MYRYSDVTGLTRVVVGALWLHMTVKLVLVSIGFYAINVSGEPLSEGMTALSGLLAVLYLLAFVASLILVGTWIYRANANAHSIGGELTIRPGWAVGWYFVPFANLVKPFQAMKETWLASHYGSEWGRGDAPDLLNWWWGFWLLSTILGNIAWRTESAAPGLSASLDLVAGILTVPLSLALISIMKQIRDAQQTVRHAEVFA